MKIRIRYKFFLGFVLVVALSFLIQALSFSLNSDQIRSQVHSIHVDKANSAVELIHNFISSVDLRLLSFSNVYQNYLDLHAAESIKQKAKEVAQQIETYLQKHPYSTVSMLQNDPLFQEIAVQPVGKTGYTAITDYDTLTCRFHTNPSIVDLDLHELSEKLPGFWSVMFKTEGGKESEGFYEWEEADGSITNKYMYIAIISTKTADNVGFHIAATTYLDEFGAEMETQEDNSDITNLVNLTMRENPFFDKITFINPATRELIKIDRFGEMPSDKLSYEIRGEPFNQALQGITALSKVYFPEEETTHPQVDFFAPILSRKNLPIGVIKAQINLSHLWNLIAQVKLGETGFAYIVDDEGRLIAHPNHKLMSQAPILTTRKIVADLLSGEESSDPEDYYYNNEFDTFVTTAGSKISGINWVVVVEQLYSEAFNRLTFSQRLFYVASGITICLLFFISLLLSANFTQPIQKLQVATRLLQMGKYEKKVNINSHDEIEELANSFNLMAGQIVKRENSLRSEKQQMETLLQSLTEGVFAVNQDGKIILFTKAASEITGLSRESIVDKEVDTVLRFYDGRRQVLLSEYQKQDEQTKGFLRDKGMAMNVKRGRVILSLRVAPIIFDGVGKQGFIVTMHDVTKERSLEDMKVDFVAMAAHELRTPITSIIGYLSLLQEEIGPSLGAEYQQFIARAMTSSKRLTALMENLLSITRIEKGKLALREGKINWSDFIKERLKDFQDVAKEKGLKLEYLPPKKPIPMVIADPLRISEVFNNLISNAITYTKKGKVSIWCEYDKDKNVINTSIKDTGQGIPKESLPNLFEKFYRVVGTLEEGSKGTGLGLYISKEIVTLHGGEIWVESEIDKGTTFSFSLPAAPLE